MTRMTNVTCTQKKISTDELSEFSTVSIMSQVVVWNQKYELQLYMHNVLGPKQDSY